MNKEVKITPQEIARAINELLDEKEKLQQENKRLHNKIDKAIEYINKIELDNYDTYIANILLDRNSDLLEILKDGDINE